MSKWINIKNAQPAYLDLDVLVYVHVKTPLNLDEILSPCMPYTMLIAHRYYRNNWITPTDNKIDEREIKYWMPLPEPPLEEEE